MTLSSTMQMAKSALHASQLGIQVAANNIANAETPGYVREQLLLSPGIPQKVRGVTTGSGVETEAIVRQVDEFLQQRMWAAASDVANGQIQQQVYSQLESAIGELGDNDLSTHLTSFFNSIGDVLNQPEDLAIRNLAILRGQSLAEQVQHLNGRANEIRSVVDDQVVKTVGEVNRMVDEVAKLNTQIMKTEQGGYHPSDAVGLRDKRDAVLKDLSSLIDIQVDEQQTGAVNVFVGGNYLVFDGITQKIEFTQGMDRDMPIHELRLSKSQATYVPQSGELAGLTAARDQIVGGFLDELDAFAGTLIYEFNQIHASGQGTTGYQQIVSQHAVTDTNQPLDVSGLTFTPRNGSFQVEILNSETGVRKTHDLRVRLQGMDNDTTLESLAADLDAIEGLSVHLQSDGRLAIESDSPRAEFSFANDTSGVLASLGINTFFSGDRAATIGINQQLRDDPSKFAVSRHGIGHDAANAEQLANMLNSPLEAHGGETLTQVYEQWVSETAQSAALATALSDGFTAFHATLEGQHLGLSGVSLDEEAINMMTFQRSFQAAARLITTVNEMLEVLMNL